mmetsp:Transcript_26189/g.76564  ORF Transcript_26189/g.76564 Transcript_26189/m.76564 type:complete len:92 (+) Transcript_26189:209-484(+)
MAFSRPVCGTDGKPYSNVGELQCANVEQCASVKELHEGGCGRGLAGSGQSTTGSIVATVAATATVACTLLCVVLYRTPKLRFSRIRARLGG